MRCKCCRKEFEVQFTSAERLKGESGVEVDERGTVGMSYGSRHEGNLYKFTLVPGWYCWGCMDKEVDAGLVQPLVVYYRAKNGALNDLRVKRYPVRGYEKEATEYRFWLFDR